MKNKLIFLSVCCLLLNSCDKENADISVPAGNYKILFISERSVNCGFWNLMVMNADGTDQRMLTDFATGFRAPIPSHSGDKVLFARQLPNFDAELYSIRMDGTELTRIDSASAGLDWSADDSKILLARYDKGTSGTDLLVYDVASKTSAIVLTSSNYLSAQFTPDNRILFTETDYPDRETFIMNLDGSNRHHIISGATEIVLSPNGLALAFVSYEKNNAPQIFLCDLDGHSKRQLTTDFTVSWDSGFPNFGNYYPHWTPDGKNIIYSSEINDGLPEIYSMTSDGRIHKRLTDNPRRNEYPIVTPDGKSILFTSNRDLDYSADIYVMQLDGRNQKPLTLWPAKDCLPILIQF